MGGLCYRGTVVLNVKALRDDLMIENYASANDNAFAGDEKVVVDKVVVGNRPVFNPFLANNEDIDKFFFERDISG
jgi:hypothetical protein